MITMGNVCQVDKVVAWWDKGSFFDCLCLSGV
jgi:hypothetical protein